MLHAILMILKIILWIILAILGLVLLVVLLVLFAPIKYKIDAKYHGTALVNAKISFLIASVRLMFDQETKRLEYSIRLAGIKLNLGKANKTKKNKKEESISADHLQSEPIDQSHDIAVENSLDEVESMVEATESNGDDNGIVDTPDGFDDLEDFDLFDDKIDKDVPKEQQSLFGRIKAFFIGLKNKLVNLRQKAEEFSPEKVEQKIESKIDKFNRTFNKLKRFWNLKCTVKTRNYLKRYLVGLVKHIGPRSIKGHVRYGFGDPCKTGQITGYLSLLPFVYSKHFSLEPNFYEKTIDTELLIKGKFRIGYIIRIVLNINIWRTILVARKIFKGKKKEV